MKNTKNKGFSLIELIVVVAIMAVLMTILAPNLIRYVDKARRQTELSNARTMLRCIERLAYEDRDKYVEAQSLPGEAVLAFELPPAKMILGDMTEEEWISQAEASYASMGKKSLLVDFIKECGGIPKSVLNDNYGYVFLVDPRNAQPVMAATVDMGTGELYLLYPTSEKFLKGESTAEEEWNAIMNDYADSWED